MYAGEQRRLSEAARAAIEDGDPLLSPVAALELTYLHEVERARDSPAVMLGALRKGIGLQIADASLAELVVAAAPLTWTRDPFDRLIAAHSIVAGAPLVTADETIRENLPQAIWD
jgi:PIN domain nuclease of toxin-antitoxin system